MAQLLNGREIEELVNQLPGWSVQGKQLVCNRRFKDFIEAINFINSLVAPAEAAQHHPDLEISYNKVTIKLTTHDSGGLTQKDFDLAKVISQL